MYKACRSIPIAISFHLISFFPYAQSPGGIMGQSIWIKGKFSNAVTSTESINFNPATPMDKCSSPYMLPEVASIKRLTVFTVYRDATPGFETVWSLKDNSGDLLLTNGMVKSKTDNTQLDFLNDRSTSVPILNTLINSNGSIATKGLIGESNNGIISIGREAKPGTVGQPESVISEFIVYDRILEDASIQKIETYLAIKYGITLNDNYVNTSGEVIWDSKADKTYSNNIAGIGRDDLSSLFQPKSTTSNDPGQLVVEIVNRERTQGVGKNVFRDKNFLIWGDNAGSLSLDQMGRESGEVIMSNRKWLMKLPVANHEEMVTNLSFQTRKLLPGTFSNYNFVLIIDKSGSGNFIPRDCSYIMPDSITSNGLAHFSNIAWDTDNSGKDVFAFGCQTAKNIVRSNNPDNDPAVSFQLFPNPVIDGHYRISIRLDQLDDVQVQVYDLNQQLIKSFKASGQSTYNFQGYINGAAGPYTVRLSTSQKTYSRVLIVQ